MADARVAVTDATAWVRHLTKRVVPVTQAG